MNASPVIPRFGNGAVRIRQRDLWAFLVAMACAVTYTALPLEIFPDRPNYLAYAADRSSILFQFYREQGTTALIFNEPLWLGLNMVLSQHLAPETIVRIIIFVPAFIVYFLGARKTGLWALAFVAISIHPVFSTNHLHHLRFALALSIFAIGVLSNRTDVRVACLIAPGFIHVSFMVFALMYVISAAPLVFRQSRMMMLTVIFIAGAAFLIVLPMIGEAARQVERYHDREVSVGGGMFLAMGIIFAVFICQSRTFLRDHHFAVTALGFYLALYWIFPYSRRFLDAAILFVLIAGFCLPPRSRTVFLAVLGGLLLIFLNDRAAEPYLGMARYI